MTTKEMATRRRSKTKGKKNNKKNYNNNNVKKKIPYNIINLSKMKRDRDIDTNSRDL